MNKQEIIEKWKSTRQSQVDLKRMTSPKHSNQIKLLDQNIHLIEGLLEDLIHLTPAPVLSLDRVEKYARNQHYLGTQGKEFVDFEQWKFTTAPTEGCTCTRGKGVEYTDEGVEYCIDCGKDTQPSERDDYLISRVLLEYVCTEKLCNDTINDINDYLAKKEDNK